MNDDFDYYGLGDPNPDVPNPDDNNPNPEPTDPIPSQEPKNSDDSFELINKLLVDKGISDVNKIKFEDDEGNIIEKEWSVLSEEEKYNILSFQEIAEKPDFNEDELQLITMMRDSKLTSDDFIKSIKQVGIEEYANNIYEPTNVTIDDFTDDELYVLDMQTKFPDITEEEIKESYEYDAANKVLFDKKITALRNEYKALEEAKINNEKAERERVMKEQTLTFNKSVETELNNFKNIGNFQLELEADDLKDVYDFITGSDKANVRHMAKALNDPEKLVKMAWFAIKGDEAMNTIHEYYKKEISNIAKQSYEKGKAEVATQYAKLQIKPSNSTNNNNNKPRDLFADDL